jgi:hypothetical protein
MNQNYEYKVDTAVNEKMDAAAQQSTGAGYVGEMCAEPPFRERMQSRLHHARREGHKAHQVEELIYLMDKHPEVARILELIELVGR